MTGVPTIAYVQHATSLGGSCVSLLASIRALEDRYRPVVVLADARARPEVEAFYRAAGVATLRWPGLATWHHVSSVAQPGWHPRSAWTLARVAQQWQPCLVRTRELLATLRPHLVHLNSITLLPVAWALLRLGAPSVWHVREHPPVPGLLEWRWAWRTQLFRGALARWHARGWPSLFLSAADRAAWLDKQAVPPQAHVLPNCVVSHEPTSRTAARQRLRIPPQAPVVLYLGGLTPFKGIAPLLQALAWLRPRLPQLHCLAPGSNYPAPTSWRLRMARWALPILGSGTQLQRLERQIEARDLQTTLIRLPFTHPHDLSDLLAASDALAFPALVPHFARPVIEAAMQGVPAVASALPGAAELITEGVTGYLVPPNNPRALAERLELLLTQPRLRSQLGQAAKAQACERYAATTHGIQLSQIYAALLTTAHTVTKD